LPKFFEILPKLLTNQNFWGFSITHSTSSSHITAKGIVRILSVEKEESWVKSDSSIRSNLHAFIQRDASSYNTLSAHFNYPMQFTYFH